ncbi:trypsin-like peptidase domain-containing protein [Aliikangiella coralliicola]|uniref:Trypsin-like serine protease n=1 Tax=Aliikangiella coralliicola TaxID=2592383 RepID=A0A545U7B7_9GAMM|nr:trypsin-like peptidase domain-containing protein [Aliikangiella coralliicola]TQV85362.1 trypsin-like serine protease [Aliikangiella coralliicola]
MKFKLISCLTILSLLMLTNANLNAAQSTRWDKTIQKVTDAVVSIRVNAVRPFDTEGSMVTQATGFVVDAQNGIILTNRHVVNPGPVTAEAIFSNSEEVELIPIYRDPIHDFGFFKFNPKSLEFIKPQELKLVDNKAQIGDEIKVIGNDSGEHMSILSGTLARLDRSAPKYRRGGYNDFNTFYFQSAADTSGGSSGSPVVNINAEVIAINAGGNNASSSSFFLPLYKITRALKSIQENKPIKRGTLQTTLSYQPYDQVRRLGLSSDLESKFRQKSDGDGLLTIAETVVDGAADKKLKPGDIVISLQSPDQKLDYVSRYEQFEIFLDEHVGEEITLTVSRQGKLKTLALTVENLHQVTPDEYMEVAGGIFNNYSYQLARQTNLSTSGVYVSSAGFMFGNAGIGRGVVLQSINNQEITNLDDFQQALSELKQNQYFTLKYVNIGAPKSTRVANVKFQTNWHVSKRCNRNDETGLWPCKAINWEQESHLPAPTEIKFNQYSDKRKNKIARSLVMVNTSLPYHVDGQNFPNYSGTGLVIDADKGLVIVDRNTVPIKMAQVDITISGVAEIPAKVLFVHPLHSFALIQYDPELVPNSGIRSAPLNTSPLESGETVWLVGYQTANRLISEKLNVSSFDPLTLPAPSIPQFREVNINAVTINNPPAVASGVLLDKRGKVRSWWTNFAFGRSTTQTIDRGLPISYVKSIRDQWRKKGKIDIYSLEVELHPVTIADARNFGLSDEWMEKFQSNGSKSQMLQITRLVAGSDAFELLKEGDLLLSIDEEIIHNFSDLDKMTQQPEINLSVWRDGEQHDFNIKTKMLSGNDTEEVYLWSGALLQKPHRALASQHAIEADGVYVSWYWFGSPANRYGLRPLNRITEFEGEKVESIEQFIQLTQKHRDKDYLRIRLLDLIGRESIITLKQDLHYWPTQKIFKNSAGWRNELVSSN